MGIIKNKLAERTDLDKAFELPFNKVVDVEGVVVKIDSVVPYEQLDEDTGDVVYKYIALCSFPGTDEKFSLFTPTSLTKILKDSEISYEANYPDASGLEGLNDELKEENICVKFERIKLRDGNPYTKTYFVEE